jgi:hypothetical protein
MASKTDVADCVFMIVDGEVERTGGKCMYSDWERSHLEARAVGLFNHMSLEEKGVPNH